jgi:hypothetical protein
MSQPKRPDIQKRFEQRMAFIFTGRMYDDDLTLAIEEEDQKRTEADE